MTATLDPQLSHRLREEVRFFIETREADLTRYGLYDTFMRVSDLDRQFQPSRRLVDGLGSAMGGAVREAIAELVAEGTLLRFDDGPVDAWRLRSRMAEIVRLTVALRQRFHHHRTFTDSKSLVQDVHYEVRPRRYPRRDLPSAALWDTMLRGGELPGATPAEWTRVHTLLEAALAPDGPDSVKYSAFQMRAFTRLAEWFSDPAHEGDPKGMVVSAGTGAGKTNAFFVPALTHAVLEKVVRGHKGTKAIAIYPRQKLAQNQFDTFLRTLAAVNAAAPDAPHLTIALDYGDMLYERAELADADGLRDRHWPVRGGVAIFPAAKCPHCRTGELGVQVGHHPKTPPLRCQATACRREAPEVRYVRQDWLDEPADFYVAVTESLNRRMLDGQFGAVFGDGTLPGGEVPSLPAVIMLDEIHLHVANKGMQIGYLVRRLKRRLKRAADTRRAPFRLALVGLSATIAQGRAFFHKLTGVPEHRVAWVAPEDGETERQGSEYYLFVKGNPEERTGVMSTLLQSAMALVHNMPQPADRRYLTLGFADSHDLVGRWRSQLGDAETQGLFHLRHVQAPRSRAIAERYFRRPPADCTACKERPNADCVVYRKGECWWPMGYGPGGLDHTMAIAAETSLTVASPDHYARADMMIATSRLEVGYDDDRIMAVIQYQAPGDAASFIQRRGRGGRQAGTYPITLAVLSPWRAADAFYFKNPHLLTEPEFKELPLNPDNRLIQRIHGFYALFEHFLARAAAEGKAPFSFHWFPRALAQDFMRWTGTAEDLEGAKAAVAASLEVGESVAIEALAFPEGVLQTGLPRLLQRMADQRYPNVKGDALLKDYLPPAFFSDINLPQLTIIRGAGFPQSGKTLEALDLAQGLRTVLPGKVSWRGERPYWLPPLLADGVDHRWYDLGDEWTLKALSTPMHGAHVPRRVAKRLGIDATMRLSVFRPDEVRVEDFQAAPWYLAEPGANSQRSVGRQTANDKLDERSAAIGLSFDEVNFSTDRVPAGMDMVANDATVPAVFGPFGTRLLGRIQLADCRFEPMRVRRIVAGADLGLRHRRGGYGETYGFRRDGEPCLLGYDMETEGVAFALAGGLWSDPLAGQALAASRASLFAFHVRAELETLGRSGFTAEKLAKSVVTALDGVPQAERAEAIESGALAAPLRQVLDKVYRFRTEDVEELGDLYADSAVRLTIGAIWRRAEANLKHPTSRDLKVHMWDLRVHSLSQALLMAAQEVAGVEVGQHLSVKTPLRLDDVTRQAPVIHLYEEGIGGLGIARALHERLRTHPMAFWDAVESKLRHCAVGDDEDLLSALLRLEEPEVRAIATHARAAWTSENLHERRQALDTLRRHGRTALGLDLTPPMIKAVLRVFGPVLEEWDVPIENWRLVREIVVHSEDRFHRERGRHPNEHELTDFVLGLLRDDPDALPALAAFHQALRDMQESEWHDRFAAAEEALSHPVVAGLFQAIASEADLQALLDLEPEARQDDLRDRHGMAPPAGVSVPPTEWLQRFDETYFQGEAHLLWPQTVWHVCHGREADMAARFAFEYSRGALRREIERRRLSSCRTACPNCLGGPVRGSDRALLNRRATHADLVALRQSAGLAVNADESWAAIAERITAHFRSGEARCYLTFSLTAQGAVSSAIAHLAMTGVRLEIGRHRLVVACSHLRALNLPAGAPTYEIGLELGDAQS